MGGFSSILMGCCTAGATTETARVVRRTLPSARPAEPALAPRAERASIGSREWARRPLDGDADCCCWSCIAKADEAMGLGICVKRGYCAGGRTLPEGLHISANGGCIAGGGSVNGPGSANRGGECRGTGSGRFLTDSSRSMFAVRGLASGMLLLLGWPASGCPAGPDAGSPCEGLGGPGGLAPRMSRTDSAICLLPRLTFSPRLCLDWRLLKPKEASLRGSELSGKTALSGCQSMAGVNLSCQDGKP